VETGQLRDWTRVRTDRIRSAVPHLIERPIFLVAPPRSGSTFLFEAMARLKGIHAFRYSEAEHIWADVFPYASRPNPDDQLRPEDADRSRRRRLKTSFYVTARRAQEGLNYRQTFVGLSPIRYLDKTISNCFHLDLLAEMFADADFVYLVRDPRANVASMIEGWPELERFGKPALTPWLRELPGATIPHWTYPAPPGWRDVVGDSLPEICAWSWRQHVDQILRFRRDGRSGELVTYEALVADPVGTVRGLASRLDLGFTEEASKFLTDAPTSRTAVSAPSPNKWSERFGSEVASVLRELRPTARELGYDLQSMT